MTSLRQKAALLERLAANDAATPAERETALRVASRLRARAPSSPRPSAPSSPHASSAGAPQWRGGVECWVGEPPVHGRVCFQGPGGCVECNAIERWRAWLRKGVSA